VPDKYELQVERQARRGIERIPERYARRIEDAIDALADEPRPHGVEKLTDRPLWRIRIGDYRIIYAIFDRERLVKVTDVKRRTDRTYGDI